MTHRNRSAGIVIKDNMVLLMHRNNNGNEYWVFPGGGQEPGETNEQTAVREIAEETTVAVQPKKLLYRIFWDNGDCNYFYLCEYLSGEPMLPQDAPEYQEAMQPGSTQSYTPQWVPIEKIASLVLYPLEIRDLFLQDYGKGFNDSTETIDLSISFATRRQG